MTRSNKIINNFVGGEISPKMYGRYDLPLYGKSLAICQNFVVQTQGGVNYRNGTAGVHNTKLNRAGVLIPFQFNDQQAYLIEATDSTFRFYANNGVVLGNDALISAINNANPGVFKVPNHGFSVNDRVHVDGIVGMTGLNGSDFLVNTVVNPSKLTLKTLSGTPVSTLNKGTYINGGKMTKVVAIAGVTVANPAVITTGSAHGLSVGDEVYISGIVGMTQLNGRFFLVSAVPSGITFRITDIFGNVISTLGTGPYTSGGNVSPVFEVATPYLEADLPFLQFTQSQDTMYIDHQNYNPMKLVRNSNANFSIATYARNADPFPDGSGDHPGVVAFIPGNRLTHANTPLHPVALYNSKSPSTTSSAFDNFTTGTLDTDALIITLAPMQGKGDAIQWISVTNQYAIIGTYNGLRSLYGSVPTEGVTPTAINALPISFYGCAPALPVSTIDTMFYVQRGNRIIRAAGFNFDTNGYQVNDVTVAADHLTVSFVQQIAFQQSLPDILWARLGDGSLAGLTFGSGSEQIAGWHKHYIAGKHVDGNGNTLNTAKVLSLGIMPRPTALDQLWMITERVINGNTVRFVEYFTDKIEFPQRQNFFTGIAATDDAKWRNAAFEAQKDSNHLDMAILYDGSVQGQISVTPGATTGVGITFTASAAFFTAAMVGRQIWKPYDAQGNGGGRATITAFTDSTHVVCTITSNFDNLVQLTPGNWLLTTNVVSGLDIWNGETLNVVGDGAVLPDANVAAGVMTISQQASTVWAGYKYAATLKTLNLEIGGVTGPAQTKMRKVSQCVAQFLDTVGGQFGTDVYRLQPIVMRENSDLMDRSVPPKSLEKRIDYTDGYTRFSMEKHVVVYHNQPVPLTLLGLDIYVDTNEVALGQR